MIRREQGRQRAVRPQPGRGEPDHDHRHAECGCPDQPRGRPAAQPGGAERDRAGDGHRRGEHQGGDDADGREQAARASRRRARAASAPRRHALARAGRAAFAAAPRAFVRGAGRTAAAGSPRTSTRPARRPSCDLDRSTVPSARGRADIQDAGVPGRLPGHSCLRGRGPVVTGAGQQFAHDRGSTADRLGGELDLDGPAFAGPRHRGRIRPVHFRVGQVLAGAEPAAEPGPEPSLAAPVPGRLGVARRRLDGQPDSGHRADVRQPGERRRCGAIARAARLQPGPGQPRPGLTRAQDRGVGEAAGGPPGGQSARLPRR